MTLLDADLAKCQDTEGEIASNDFRPLQCRYIQPGAHLGGGGLTLLNGACASSLQGFDPCRPKGSPFVIFWDIHCWLTDSEFFLKAPWAPIYTNF